MRFYTTGTIRVFCLAKIPTFYRDWLRSLNLKKGLIICIVGKGGLKDIHCITQNDGLFASLL